MSSVSSLSCKLLGKDSVIGVWAGGGMGGHVPPPQIFYGRAKITAKFGQNIKISEKF
jgi:hypothetical protein